MADKLDSSHLSGSSLSGSGGSGSFTVGGTEYLNGKWWEVPAVCLLMLVLAIISTYPLILHFDTAIPYAPFGGARAWNRSGDQVQLMYWFWLVKENFLGAIPFDSNPFEFNMPVPHPTSGLNTIPLAFFYMLFSPLGDVAAYNCTIFSSYVLAGLFMYLLVREYCGSRTGALLAALIFTFAPSRINGFTAGHGYGFLFFCYPFILYFLEKGIRSKKIRYGIVSSIGLIFLSMLEPHLIYYICVFLGLYIPFRVLILFPLCRENSAGCPQSVIQWEDALPERRSLLLIWGAGVSMVVYTQVFLTCGDQPFFTPVFWWIIALYPLILLLSSLCFAALYQRLAPVSFRAGLAVEAGSLLPLFVFLPLALQACSENPIATGVLVAGALIAVFAMKIWLLRSALPSMVSVLAHGIRARKRAIYPMLPLVFSMGGIVFWIASSKIKSVASTIAGGGRSLEDVGLYSARLSDLFSSISSVYIGVVPAVLAGGLLLFVLWTVAFARRREKFTGEAEILRLFYLVVAFCCLLLALGLAFGKASLYILFYHYFPFFNYPRVSDRIITLSLFALAIVAGFVVRSLQRRCHSRMTVTAVTLAVLIAAGLQLKEYNILKPMGINILDKGQDIYSYVQKNIGDGLLLEIPLWPGDSHQSSLYQHYIMLDRVPRVNGCSPMVLKEYIDTVFEPLAPINQGRLDRKQYELLRRMGVRYITVHDNRDVFLQKVSPFKPITTVRRLKNSPYLDFVDIDNTMYFKTFAKKNDRLYLFRVKDRVSDNKKSEPAWYEMPYFYDVHWRLHHQTGSIVKDEETGRMVFQATAGRDKPGFLVYGPYDIYSPGDYRCYFTIYTDPDTTGTVARLEVSKVTENGETVVLARRELQGKAGTGTYRKLYLDFSITENTKLEFRVFYYGKGRIRVEKIVVNKIGHDVPLYALEAETMVGDTGQLVFVDGASNGKVVEAVVGKSKKGDMVYGPNRIYPKGKYTARFFLRKSRAKKKNAKGNAAELLVTDGRNITTYGKRMLTAQELNKKSFSGLDVDFELARADELSFHVRFMGTVGLQLDNIEIIRR